VLADDLVAYESMAKKNNTNSELTSINSGLIANDFYAIEALNEFYAANGWDADYRQVDCWLWNLVT
jgi:hypothetical protein